MALGCAPFFLSDDYKSILSFFSKNPCSHIYSGARIKKSQIGTMLAQITLKAKKAYEVIS
jgi:hypothetical protein